MVKPVEHSSKIPTNGAKPLAWRVAGLISLALGVLGILLPLLPTTPFLLLAAYCFGRGSERLLKWLLNHPRLGPPIRDWRDHRAISRKAKALAAVAMVVVVATTVILDAPPGIVITQIVAMILVGTFIFTRPSL